MSLTEIFMINKVELAIYIDEYVPITTPAIKAKEKPKSISPPNINSDIKTNNVVKEVIKVLDKVWLIELLVRSSVSMFSTIEFLKFSLILSKTTIVSFKE